MKMISHLRDATDQLCNIFKTVSPHLYVPVNVFKKLHLIRTFLKNHQSSKLFDCIPAERGRDGCSPMRHFAETWGNASDHDANDVLFEFKRIRRGVFELPNLPQN
jgi:hypothetical protein